MKARLILLTLCSLVALSSWGQTADSLATAPKPDTVARTPKSGTQLVISTSAFNGIFTLVPRILGAGNRSEDYPYRRLNFGVGVQFPFGLGVLLEAGDGYKAFPELYSTTYTYTRYLHGTLHYQLPVVADVSVGPYLGVYYGVRQVTTQISIPGNYYSDYNETINYLAQRRWNGSLGLESHFKLTPRFHMVFRTSLLGIGSSSSGPTEPDYFAGLGYARDPRVIYFDMHLRYHFF